MSEEEIIKHCKDFIEENKSRPIILHKAIQNLLDLYNKEKEENQMLRKVNKIAEGVTVKDVEKAILNANNELKENYIEKSKVREKIKELQEEYIQLFELERKDGERETDCKIVIGEMEILEKLLQEGDDK